MRVGVALARLASAINVPKSVRGLSAARSKVTEPDSKLRAALPASVRLLLTAALTPSG